MKKKGFTLIELIITLILAGILAITVVPYFQSGITRSSDALNYLSVPLRVQKIMSLIIADYNSNTTYQQNLSSLETNIGLTSNNPYGIDSTYAVTINNQYKFQTTDVNYSLMVTIQNNQGTSQESVTYIFTRKS